MTIAAIEGVAIDLAGSELFQAIEQPQARQLSGLRSQPRSQGVRGGVAESRCSRFRVVMNEAPLERVAADSIQLTR